MIKKILVLISICLLTLNSDVLAQMYSEENADEIIIKIKEYYGKTIGFESNYTLVSNVAGMGSNGATTDKTTSGIIIFVKPDRLRIIQKTPELEEVIYSPDGYWWYSQKENIAHRFPSKDVAGTVDPFISFFSGLDSTSKYFKMRRISSHDDYELNLKAIRLVPKSIDMGLNRIDIMVKENGEIYQSSLHTLIGDSFKYTFKNVTLLSEPPQIGFHFIPPSGVRVIHH